jgi:hypothetical protein
MRIPASINHQRICHCPLRKQVCVFHSLFGCIAAFIHVETHGFAGLEDGITYKVFDKEEEMADIVALIDKDLSEPYSIFTVCSSCDFIGTNEKTRHTSTNLHPLT